MDYDKLLSLVNSETNIYKGQFSIWEIQNIVEKSDCDSIFIQKNLLKRMMLLSNKDIFNNNFDKLLSLMSIGELKDLDNVMIIIRKMFGGFDMINLKYYCIDGKEIKLNILEDRNDIYADMFLLKSNKLTTHIVCII